MKHALIVFALLLSPVPAIACSCGAPETAAERRDYARFIAAKADAIVEVEPVAGPNIQRQIGDTYRIVKVIAGAAQPGTIRMARSFGRDRQTGQLWMGGTSCDVFLGHRKQVLLMRAGYAPTEGGAVVPGYALPNRPCGQVLPVKDAPAAQPGSGYVPVFSFGGSCQDWLLSEAGVIDLIREEARKLGRPLY